MISALTAPADELFYRRDDPGDPRLGELVARGAAGYAAARVVILGCPQDAGVRRNRGRPGAAGGPAAIRRCLYKLGAAGLEGLAICDLGDTPVDGELEAIHARQRAVAAQVVGDGKLLVSLGGGNDISYPDMAAMAAAAPGPHLAINVDAHYDVRADEPRNSGTPYRQLIEGGDIAGRRLWVVGAQPYANSAAYGGYLASQGASVLPLRAARAAGVAAAVAAMLAASDAASVGWGLDMDVVIASEAPGVSAPNPLGMRGEELVALAELAGGEPRTRLIEISELCPPHDIDERTARLAAVAIWHALAALARR